MGDRVDFPVPAPISRQPSRRRVPRSIRAAFLREAREQGWSDRYPVEVAVVLRLADVAGEAKGDEGTRAAKAVSAAVKDLREMDARAQLGGQQQGGAKPDPAPDPGLSVREGFLGALGPFAAAVGGAGG